MIRFKGDGGVLGLSALNTTDNLLVSGVLRLQGGGIRKNYTIKDMPFNDFLAMLGVDPADLMELF